MSLDTVLVLDKTEVQRGTLVQTPTGSVDTGVPTEGVWSERRTSLRRVAITEEDLRSGRNRGTVEPGLVSLGV